MTMDDHEPYETRMLRQKLEDEHQQQLSGILTLLENGMLRQAIAILQKLLK